MHTIPRFGTTRDGRRRGDRWLGAPTRRALARPKTTIAAGVLAVFLAGAGLPHLEIRADGTSLVPLENPQVAASHAIRDAFCILDQLVVVIRSEHPDGIFNASTLELIKDLTGQIAGLDGLDPGQVMSLATEHGDRVVPGTVTVRTYLEPLPRGDQEIRRLRDDLRRIDLYFGTLVSRHERAAAIFVGIPEGVDRGGLFRRITDLALDHRDRPERIGVVGGAAAEALLGTHILDDLGVPEWIAGPDVRRRPGEPNPGWPRSVPDLRRLVARTIGLMPVAIGAMALVLLTFFRRLAAAALPLCEVAACLVFVLGLMGWAGVPVYLTIAVMPVILTAVGIADEIHIFHRYRGLMREVPDDRRGAARSEVVVATMDEMARPIALTSVTTAIGFLSFTLSPIGAVQAFGVFTAAGVLFCMVWSLTVIPACLVTIDPARLVADRSHPSPARPVIPRLAALILRARVFAIAAAVVLVVVAPFGILRIMVQDSWIGGFAPDSAFYRDTIAFNDDFLGSHLLLVSVNARGPLLTGEVEWGDVATDRLRLPKSAVEDPEGVMGAWVELHAITGERSSTGHVVEVIPDGDDLVLRTDRMDGSIRVRAQAPGPEPLRYVIGPRDLADPAVLELLCDLEAFIAAHSEEAVGGVLGPCAYLTTTNFLLSGRREAYRHAPSSRRRADRVWWHLERVRGGQRRRNLADEGLGRGLVTVFLTDPDFRRTAHLMDEIRSFEGEHLAPSGITLDFAGDVAVSQTLIGAIVSTQVRSLLLSLLGIVVVTTLLGRSLVWGFCCVLPCALTVLVNFTAMGTLGIPLGVATSMFAGMTLGIGVDYAIHLMERYRFAGTRGLAGRAAIMDALTQTGPAIVIDAAAVAIGFGVLLLSLVPANARLGGFLASSVLGCLLTTLVLLPSLLALAGRAASSPRPGAAGPVAPP